jgi:surfeit locus 1 family protein
MISSPRLEKLRRTRFRPGIAPTVAALVGLAVLVALGTWQMQRLHWKEGLIAHRAAQLAAPAAALPETGSDWRAFDYRRVEATGVFRHDLEQLFGVRKHGQELGHQVLTPLLRSDGSAVLVDRGWVPRERIDPSTRPSGQVSGQVTLTGIARYRKGEEQHWFTPDNQPEAGHWYWYDLDAMEQALGLELLPVVLEADDTPNPGGLPVGGLTIIALPNNHLQYAMTWYGLALTLVAVYIGFSLKSREDP